MAVYMLQGYVDKKLVVDYCLNYEAAEEAFKEFHRKKADFIKVFELKEIKMELNRGLERFEIWCEGYAATGQSAGATLLGEVEGTNFKDACRRLASVDPGFELYFSEEIMTFWGCRLFDNEAEARKSFG